MAPAATAFHANTEVMVGLDCLEKGNDPAASLPRDKSCSEVARIKDIKGDQVTFFTPLKRNHPANDLVSPEFVRYRWWVDVDMGTVFWHDHAFGATTWPHGGFGVTLVEPSDPLITIRRMASSCTAGRSRTFIRMNRSAPASAAASVS